MIFYDFCEIIEGKTYTDSFGNIVEIISMGCTNLFLDRSGRLWTINGIAVWSGRGVIMSKTQLIKRNINNRIYRLFDL